MGRPECVGSRSAAPEKGPGRLPAFLVTDRRLRRIGFDQDGWKSVMADRFAKETGRTGLAGRGIVSICIRDTWWHNRADSERRGGQHEQCMYVDDCARAIRRTSPDILSARPQTRGEGAIREARFRVAERWVQQCPRTKGVTGQGCARPRWQR